MEFELCNLKLYVGYKKVLNFLYDNENEFKYPLQLFLYDKR